MAVLHKKEEKIQAVLGKLPENYTEEQFVEMFIRLFSKDWGKLKSAYIKQSQDKEPGTTINMPAPAVYLKQLLKIYLQQADANPATEVSEPASITSQKADKKPSPKATGEKPVKKTPAKK